jgi:SulP family sulfate permease
VRLREEVEALSWGGERLLSAPAAASPAPTEGTGLRRYVPILEWLPQYNKKWLVGDTVAGVSVWALLIPQALAYATIAGVPVQYGLYTAFVALVAYAIFGTSRQMIQGPSAAVAAVSAAVVGPIVGASALGTNAAVGYTAALALAAGALYLALGLLRMGWVSNFLSKAVMAGFVLGFSFGIVIDQLYKVLGVPKAEGSYVQILWGTLSELGATSGTTLAVGASSLAALLLLRYVMPRVPRALVVVTLSIVAVRALDLTAHGVAVTGEVPTGLFSIGLPDVGWSQTNALVIGALSIVFVGFSESLASARAMALKHGYEIDPNRELVAEGVAVGASGFVGGFATDGSLSKTSVADAAGQKTQMASLINAIFVLLTLVLLAGLFENLPKATLGAVVIDAMLGLIAFTEMRRYYRVNRADWVFFTAAMAGILFFGIIQGIAIGVALSLLLLIARTSQTSLRRLGRDPRSGSFFDVAQHEGLQEVQGVLVVRMDGPLFFADASRFRQSLSELIRESPEPVRAVVLDADSVQLTDTDGADILIQVRGELAAQGTSLVFARVHPKILRLWRRGGLDERNGSGHVYVTVREAVDAVSNEPAS